MFAKIISALGKKFFPPDSNYFHVASECVPVFLIFSGTITSFASRSVGMIFHKLSARKYFLMHIAQSCFNQ